MSKASCLKLNYFFLFCRTSFSDFARQYGRDERFKAIEKMKERESLFNEYVNEMKKLAKERDEQQKMEIKNKAEKVRYL